MSHISSPITPVAPRTSTRFIHREATFTHRQVQATEAPITPVKARRSSVKAHRKLALLLPGHNEELIIEATIKSAVAAGQPLADIYVVNDASTDKTRQIATALLGKSNVLNVRRSGKALAVHKAIKKFEIESRYDWVHVADADSLFSPTYFKEYRKKLSPEYAVAVGFVQSLRGNWISTYRAITYTYSQHFTRRIQSYLGMISVFPGPVTCFRTDILKHLEINGNSMTEDFDMTLQVHRKNLGKILYIPKAVNYTQDPQNFSDFRKQNMRWYRGFFQGVKQYNIGLGHQRIDISIGLQVAQLFIFLIQIGILFPYIMYRTHNWLAIPVAIAADFTLMSIITLMSSLAIKRWYLLGAMPYFYILRTSELLMYMQAFIEIFILRRFAVAATGWATEGRRYKVNQAALQDIKS